MKFWQKSEATERRISFCFLLTNMTLFGHETIDGQFDSRLCRGGCYDTHRGQCQHIECHTILIRL